MKNQIKTSLIGVIAFHLFMGNVAGDQGHPPTYWWAPQHGVQVISTTPPQTEFGGNSANYTAETSATELNHLPSNPEGLSETVNLPFSGMNRNTYDLDLSDITDPDGDNLVFEFSYIRAYEINWDPDTKILSFGVNNNEVGATVQITVSVIDVNADNSYRSSPVPIRYNVRIQ
jgi:hypothetical protein